MDSANHKKPKVDGRLEAIIALLEDTPSREEFVEAFENAIRLITSHLEKATQEADALKGELSQLAKKVKEDTGSDLFSLKADATATFTSLTKDINTTLEAQVRKVDQKLATVRDGADGKDGKDGVDGKPGKDGSPDTGDQIIEKINAASKHISQEAVDGLLELLKRYESDIKRANSRVSPGRSLLQLYVNGAKKGAVQYLNITGSGVSYNYANGRNDVTITGGSGSLSVLAATGTVDDSNTSFTFPSAPTLVVVNGTVYRDGKGVTISGTSVTLDAPVGTGGDIYGLG